MAVENLLQKTTKDGGNVDHAGAIIDHLDIWTSAIKTKSAVGRGSSKKQELVGIKKLRELILELAVRGKLVPQNPNDEPTSELLKKIDDEKVQLLKDGKIKKQKPLSQIADDEKLFELPDGWQYTRVGRLAVLKGGFAYQSSKFIDAGEHQVIRMGNIRPDFLHIDKNCVFITPDYGATTDDYRLEINDILLTMTGTKNKRDYLYSVSIKPEHLKGRQLYLNQRLCAVKAPRVSTDFLSLCLKNETLLDSIFAKSTGTANQANIGMEALLCWVIPLAPLAEQHRIVAKVDELMVLCDQLEAQTEASIDAHKTLVEVLLATLTDAKDADELNENWQTISQHFDVLFTTQASIEQLKQTILQLAVMGKLVKQNPNDEPASKLLERIATEKQQLIKDGKIKKQTLLPAITDEKKPFKIPTGWSYTRLDDLCANVFSGSTPPKSELNETSGIPFLKVYNIQNQELEFEQRTLFVSENSHTGKLKRSILYPGDVVLNLVGPPLGKVAIMPNTYPEWNCNQNIICFRPLEIKLNRYIYTYLKSHIFLDYIDLVGSAGQDFISGAKCRAIVLPTPPLAEQQRIVAKVEELMVLCDSLKTRLNQAQTTKLDLTDAIVEQAL